MGYSQLGMSYLSMVHKMMLAQRVISFNTYAADWRLDKRTAKLNCAKFLSNRGHSPDPKHNITPSL